MERNAWVGASASLPGAMLAFIWSSNHEIRDGWTMPVVFCLFCSCAPNLIADASISQYFQCPGEVRELLPAAMVHQEVFVALFIGMT